MIVTIGVLLTTPAAKDTENPNPAAAVKNALPTRNAVPVRADVRDLPPEPVLRIIYHVLCATTL